MSVLDRSALVDSPLADLHAIASELTIDGYRRLRRPELVEAILDRQRGAAGASPGSAESGPEDAAPTAEPESAGRSDEPEDAPAPRRRSRGGRGRSRAAAGDTADAPAGDGQADGEAAAPTGEVAAPPADDEEAPTPRRSRSRTRAKSPTDDSDAEVASAEPDAAEPARPARGRRGRGKVEEPAESSEREPRTEAEETVAGVVELLPGGSGFVRVAGTEPSDGDVYISSAQVKRCELVTGDRVTGPKRAPRRSERFASLIRIETINGRPASEQADSVRFEDLPAALPSERITIGSEDPTLGAIEWLTPFGRGSRVTITGAARSGKTETLRRLAAALTDAEDLTVTVALAGVRPEEVSEWPVAPAAAVSFAAAEEVQVAALEPVVDQARRLAARGEHAVVLIDGLDGISTLAARKLTASARAITDGGSVTIVATASAPIGGETTVIALDVGLTSIARFPALDLVASGTLRPELLVGDAGAQEIARTRAGMLGEDED